jgi:hypothetical protein
MQRIVLAGMLLMAGCQHVVGPFQSRTQRIDDPAISIEEQQRRGRERLALPQDQDSLAPKTYSDFPSPTGR